MDKPKHSAFWQRLTNFAKVQSIDIVWWLILLIFFGMSVNTVLVWRSLLKDNQSQVNNTVSLNTPIKPQTDIQPPTVTPLTFAGSGVSLEITRILARQFQKTHPEIKINVPASIGSGGAIQAAADGAVAVGMVSRPLKEKEKKLGLTVIAIAKTPLAFAVHPSVADNNITSAQLLDIYQGKKTQWLDGKEIIVLTREPSDSSILILEQKISGFKQVYTDSQKDERWTTLYKDQQMNQQLEKTPLALGIADIGTITTEKRLSSIKILKFNGIAPTIENAAKGKYLLVKNLYFVFHPGKISPDAQEFIKFVRSQDGAKILAANSYLAMGEDKK
ncbi:PstS family phosphate ABC transporter substrate-binding protein [Synechocystis sp. PCC 7509]|uniref:PstS family phosphate ABC transporter substrate-binding protein n=1 Tax=Synechocystis sp. PCC 7509 TaxID=927677 RepID=UPI0002AC4E2A|nr:substrate-binding domain-containing protein [Synechocystis sp. PCC 7509]